MRTLSVTLAAATLALMSAGPASAEGPIDAHIDGLNLGTYWYGARIDKRDLIGKVVLVEIWGS